MKALVTGATGFIGGRLLSQLDHPVVLTRNPERTRAKLPGVKVFGWNPMTEHAPAAAFEGVDTVFHLAGDSVGEGRWTKAKKARIRDSRVIGTNNLVAGMAALQQRPAVLISASAVGYYGLRGDEILTETSNPGDDFLAEVCQAWETASAGAKTLGMRVVNPRTSVVLGPGGGALAKMLLPFKLGVGGRLGTGRQWMPWIHLHDLVEMLLFAARTTTIAGPMNAAAPQPVTNAEFTRVLAKVLHRPAIFPVPAFALRLALGEFAEALLGSERVVPVVASEAGFQFKLPELEQALRACLNHGPSGSSKTTAAGPQQ